MESKLVTALRHNTRRRGVLKMDLAVLVHTMDSYRFLWPGWHNYFHKHWDFTIDAPVYFATEEVDARFPGVRNIKTGTGEWSDRLLRVLSMIENTNIFYLQEDFWPVRTLSKQFFEDVFGFFIRNKLDALRLAPGGNYVLHWPFNFIGRRMVRRFCNRKSLYLVNHQASFCTKRFLIQCLLPNESPWKNEMEGTERIRKLNPKICMLKLRWYNEVCRKGRLTAAGEAMMASIGSSKAPVISHPAAGH